MIEKKITVDPVHRQKLTVRERVFNMVYGRWNKTGLIVKLKARRVARMLEAIEFDSSAGSRILEIGCGNGQDFVRFLDGHNVEIVGLDIHDYGIKQSNFQFVSGDAASLPFPDKYFDAAVSIGVLEHIEPISKLLAVISEIDRVSKSYAVVMPSISTIVEPHTGVFFWQLRRYGRKRGVPALNYFSDEAWIQFDGFVGARPKTFYYIFPLIKNIMISKGPSQERPQLSPAQAVEIVPAM